MSNPMSGEKLVLAHSKTSFELPTMGVKEFEPNHSWLEQKQIQSALDQRKMLLEAERVEKEANLMSADWSAEKRKAAVSRRGRHWETFGHRADDADWLFPEETLFLMEMGYLVCCYGEVPLSIQKAYSVLLKPENGCSLDEYRVFAHLCRAGYRVLRHLPNLTVTAYERTIRLDQHLDRTTYSDVVTGEKVSRESVGDRTQACVKEIVSGTEESVSKTEESVTRTEESVTGTQVPDKSLEVSERSQVVELEEMVIDETTISDGVKDSLGEVQVPKVPDGPETDEKHGSNKPEEMVIDEMTVTEKVKDSVSEAIMSEKPDSTSGDEIQGMNEPVETVSSAELSHRTEKSVTNWITGLTKRQLRKIQRRKAGDEQGVRGVKHIQRKRQRNWLLGIKRKYKNLLTNYSNSRHQHKSRQNDGIEHQISKKTSARTPEGGDEASDVPPERWQPPVVISDLPEDIEMTIGSTPVGLQAGHIQTEQETIEVIDIADTSSEGASDTDEVVSDDSDIEIIQEIPRSQNEEEEEEEESEEDEDDVEIIEVPVPKKEIIIETLSSDSEKDEDEDESGSESERSYDGNWKRGGAKKKKFVRPPTMSHFTFAAVDEFCAEKKPPKDVVNGEDHNEKRNDEFIGLESSNTVVRPRFRVEKSRNEILDLMPTMAGQTKKLMTLDVPDAKLVPEGVDPRQHSYTFSTNVLRARVFRQGFRGRRNFHGPRFSSFNPYYNNVNGNFYPNQLSIAGPGPQGLFQAPQLAQLLGGDVNSMARGVMQIASALLMNLPQNNMNNGILPYHPRPHFPMPNQNFSHNSLSVSTPRFPPANPNFSHESNVHHHSFNTSQRNSDIQNLFDMPQQRNIRTPNHIRFSESSSSPIEDAHSVDPARSSESDFDSRDHNFTPPIRNSHSANRARNFRGNRAANFRSKTGRFKRKHQNQRGGFSPRNARGGSSRPQWIDPAYIKQDVPIPGERNTPSQNISDFIPISSSSTNQKAVEVISIDDNDDGFVPRGGISSRFTMRKRLKRKLRLKAKAKKRCLAENSVGGTNPEIVFLDSPSSVKQETDSGQVKVENRIKEESLESNLKRESVDESRVKVENEARVKTEAIGESSEVRVKVEGEGQNLSVEIKIESHSDTSPAVSLPLANLVKEEPNGIKREADNTEVKSEVVKRVKAESADGEESKEGIVTSVKNDKQPEADCQEAVTSARECESGDSVAVDQTENIEVEMERENDDGRSEVCTTESDVPRTVSSWAEMKKKNLPLSSQQESEVQDKSESESEEEDEIRPLLRPRHCKTIGTVLSALQIFTPFAGSPPEDIQRLKISFDLYLPTDFRKSHRGLPHYRIVVFSGSDPPPSPTQLREVNSRFQDKVPVLTAVVAPGSVVFYTFSDVDLPVDSTSYSK